MGEDNSEKHKAVLTWIEEKQNFAVGLVLFLIFIYVLPILFLFIAQLRTNNFLEESYFLSIFSAFLKTSDSYLEDFHKIIFPLISGLSIISYKNKSLIRIMILQAIIILILILTVWFHANLNINEVQDALAGLPNPIDFTAMADFFIQIKTSLFTYLLILLGIQVSNKMQEG